MKFSDLKGKTWIDWLKVMVAIDIAAVGIGLILNENMHIFAHILGFITRILFGLMYVFIAVLIFKRVFPDKQDESVVTKEETELQSSLDDDIRFGLRSIKNFFKKLYHKSLSISDKVMGMVDHFLEKMEKGATKRKDEVKDEVKKLMEKK